MFLGVDDFTGKYELHTGMYDQSKLLDYIEIYEKRYLIDLLGAKLYDEFMSDLDINDYPESPNFQKIFDPFHEDNASTGFFTTHNLYNKVVISYGILEMLKGFIYFEYIKDTANQMTSNGQVIPQNENSLTASTLYNMMYTRYWEALKTYRAIQWYIITNNNLKIGEVLNYGVFNYGNGYLNNMGTVQVVGGSGTGFTVEYFSDGDAITEIEIIDTGQNYQSGDEVEIPGGTFNAKLLIVNVSKGDFKKFNGVPKQMAYWL